MKRNRLLVYTIVTSLMPWLANSQEIYRAFVNEVCISTNASGQLVYRTIGNRNFIQKCAQDEGITNLTGLSLVFNRTANALQVVSGTNHDLICTPLSFSGGESLSNSNMTRVERLEFVYVGTNTLAGGTLFATERTNAFTGFRLTGRLQYATAAEGTNGPAIYSGTLFAGRLFSHRDRDDDDDDQGEDEQH